MLYSLVASLATGTCYAVYLRQWQPLLGFLALWLMFGPLLILTGRLLDRYLPEMPDSGWLRTITRLSARGLCLCVIFLVWIYLFGRDFAADREVPSPL